MAFSDVAIETKSFFVKSSGCRVSVKCLSLAATLALHRFTQTVYLDCKSEKVAKGCYILVMCLFLERNIRARLKVLVFNQDENQNN